MIVEGKDKNWGSRSGRGRSKAKNKLNEMDRLLYHGLPQELIDFAETNPEAFLENIRQLGDGRKVIKAEACETPLRKVFNTESGSLYNADCIKLMEKRIDDNSIDCIFADPPFNLSKIYGKGISDQVKDEEYLEWTRVWLDLCCAKLKEGGSFFVFNIPKWSSYISHYLSQKLEFRHWIAVDLTLSMPIPNKLYPSHYSLLYFTKGKKPNHFSPSRVPLKACVRCGKEQNDYGGHKKKINPEGLNLRDIWTDIPPVRHGKNKNRDANELSLKLLERVLDIATDEGDLVFDPFGGAGTTYVAAELMGRKWIGVELGDCNPIIERLKDPANDIRNINKYNNFKNTLFTDDDLRNRHKHGLSLSNFRIPEDQIKRAIPQKDLFH